MRLGSQLFLWLVLLSLSVYTLFYISWQVEALEEKRAALVKKIKYNNKIYAGLEAEWSYLASPARIEKLATRFLPELNIPDHDQLVYIKDMPSNVYTNPTPEDESNLFEEPNSNPYTLNFDDDSQLIRKKIADLIKF